jgi:glutamyl-Q tRNA(Asp) synthetase
MSSSPSAPLPSVSSPASARVTRFAPSPTGYLHVGHAYSARVAWAAAREAGGRFLLRIEDIDRTRCRAELTDALIDDLRFLGLSWDGEPRVQSRHMAEYAAVLDALQAQGLLYPCFCTRAEIAAEAGQAAGAPHDLPAPPSALSVALPAPQVGRLYPGTCRRISTDEAAERIARGAGYALRLHSERALAQARELAGRPLTFRDLRFGEVTVGLAHLGDVVLGRKEVRASYHVAVTLDDHLQGVTRVTRGEDLFHATHIHRVLQTLLGWREPEYAHHPLISDGQGERLAKRRGSPSLRSLRQAGRTAAEIWALAGLPPLS